MEKSKYRTSVIVGRWQVKYLHEGHLHLINVASTYAGIENVVIYVGSQSYVDERNPYTFDERKEMIQKQYPSAVIEIIEDVPGNNKAWSKQLDLKLKELYSPVLFGSRDSFKQHYTGKFPYIEVDEIKGVSGTLIRESVK